MMEETNKDVVETPEQGDDSRRDFLSKAIGAAGAMMAAGLAAGVMRPEPAEAMTKTLLNASSLKAATLNNGARLSIPGDQLGNLLGTEAGMANNLKGKNMTVTLEWA